VGSVRHGGTIALDEYSRIGSTSRTHGAKKAVSTRNLSQKRGVTSTQYLMHRNSDVESDLSDSQMEDINATRRLVSDYRSKCNKLKVELNDWKNKYAKETKRL
jgi:hypothetical protein